MNHYIEEKEALCCVNCLYCCDEEDNVDQLYCGLDGQNTEYDDYCDYWESENNVQKRALLFAQFQKNRKW